MKPPPEGACVCFFGATDQPGPDTDSVVEEAEELAMAASVCATLLPDDERAWLPMSEGACQRRGAGPPSGERGEPSFSASFEASAVEPRSFILPASPLRQWRANVSKCEL